MCYAHRYTMSVNIGMTMYIEKLKQPIIENKESTYGDFLNLLPNKCSKFCSKIGPQLY